MQDAHYIGLETAGDALEAGAKPVHELNGITCLTC
jgi:hypothetical protein